MAVRLQHKNYSDLKSVKILFHGTMTMEVKTILSTTRSFQQMRTARPCISIIERKVTLISKLKS